jgi:hypothetical protein
MNAGGELVRGERFHHIVIHPDREPLDEVPFSLTSGYMMNGNMESWLRPVPDLPHEPPTIYAGHVAAGYE